MKLPDKVHSVKVAIFATLKCGGHMQSSQCYDENKNLIKGVWLTLSKKRGSKVWVNTWTYSEKYGESSEEFKTYEELKHYIERRERGKAKATKGKRERPEFRARGVSRPKFMGKQR
jgi:hypothetical protein